MLPVNGVLASMFSICLDLLALDLVLIPIVDGKAYCDNVAVIVVVDGLAVDVVVAAVSSSLVVTAAVDVVVCVCFCALVVGYQPARILFLLLPSWMVSLLCKPLLPVQQPV